MHNHTFRPQSILRSLLKSSSVSRAMAVAFSRTPPPKKNRSSGQLTDVMSLIDLHVGMASDGDGDGDGDGGGGGGGGDGTAESLLHLLVRTYSDLRQFCILLKAIFVVAAEGQHIAKCAR
mmetsp:Transcript_57693/g.158987  ORF Transcript_57693/g.158987 Transcript_57693/m.158987 type:complete len:120 (-) Transcript_57693:330-689(-)